MFLNTNILQGSNNLLNLIFYNNLILFLVRFEFSLFLFVIIIISL